MHVGLNKRKPARSPKGNLMKRKLTMNKTKTKKKKVQDKNSKTLPSVAHQKEKVWTAT